MILGCGLRLQAKLQSLEAWLALLPELFSKAYIPISDRLQYMKGPLYRLGKGAISGIV